MLGFARFLPASSDVFQKVLFGNCVVGFDVVSANTSAGSNELTDNSSQLPDFVESSSQNR